MWKRGSLHGHNGRVMDSTGGTGWYWIWIVLGPLKHREVMQLGRGAGVTQQVLVWSSGCHMLWGQTEWDDTKGPEW